MAYQKEERERAIQLLRESGNVKKVSEETGIQGRALYNWAKKEGIILKAKTTLKERTEEKREKAIKLMRDGMSIAAISRELIVSETTLYDWRREEGIESTSSKAPNKYKGTELYDEIVDRMRDGDSINEISKDTGVSSSILYGYMREEGLTDIYRRQNRAPNPAENPVNSRIRKLRKAIEVGDVERIEKSLQSIEKGNWDMTAKKGKIVREMTGVAREIIAERKNGKGNKESKEDERGR